MRLLGGKIYYGWLALAAISGINFANSVTSIGMLTVFVLPMSDEFGWNRTQISGASFFACACSASWKTDRK